MPIEQLVAEYKRQHKIIRKAMEEQWRIIDEILELDEEEKDWITPRKAAEILGSSVQWIYQLRDNGTLGHIKYVRKRLYVSRSEVNAIDDTPDRGEE